MTIHLPVFTNEEATEILTGLAALNPFFVQIGAMDGVSFDVIHPFIRHFKWPGLLVEPMPEQFAALKENYLGHPGAEFANVAITTYDGTITMRYLDPSYVADGRLPREVLGMSTISTKPDHFLAGDVREDYKPHLAAATRTIEVPCTTLQNLLDKHNVKKIDLFVCDTEGADWLILQQLDLTRYQPQVIYFEYVVLTPDEMEACVTHFQNAGYTVKIEGNHGQNILVYKTPAKPVTNRLFV